MLLQPLPSSCLSTCTSASFLLHPVEFSNEWWLHLQLIIFLDSGGFSLRTWAERSCVHCGFHYGVHLAGNSCPRTPRSPPSSVSRIVRGVSCQSMAIMRVPHINHSFIFQRFPPLFEWHHAHTQWVKHKWLQLLLCYLSHCHGDNWLLVLPSLYLSLSMEPVIADIEVLFTRIRF